MKYDLHIHSKYASDGVLERKEIGDVLIFIGQIEEIKDVLERTYKGI